MLVSERCREQSLTHDATPGSGGYFVIHLTGFGASPAGQRCSVAQKVTASFGLSFSTCERKETILWLAKPFATEMKQVTCVQSVIIMTRLKPPWSGEVEAGRMHTKGACVCACPRAPVRACVREISDGNKIHTGTISPSLVRVKDNKKIEHGIQTRQSKYSVNTST